MKNFVFIIVGLISSLSHALDCEREVASLWTGKDSQHIYIKYKDSYQPASMRLVDVDNDPKIIDRTYSAILAGAMSGKKMKFRYTGGYDGSAASCQPTVKQKLIGVWVDF